jgi:ABC-type lipoprotein release transport system permease subunit
MWRCFRRRRDADLDEEIRAHLDMAARDRREAGATPGIVVGGVLRDHLRPVLAGLGLGLLSALALSRVLDGLLYGVRATDAPTFIGVTIALGLIAFLAALFPARRAARVDPVIALRSE